MSYVIHILTTINLFVLLAISLDLLVGYAGLMSLAHAAFFGLGAYSTALLTKMGWSALVAQGAGMLLAACLSSLIALPSMRIKGIYLLIITMSVQVGFTVTAQNWIGLTGGEAGVSSISPYSLFGYEFRGVPFLLLCILFTLLWFVVCRRLVLSPFGRLLVALRDDETGCTALGKNVGAAKIAVFAFSASIAAFAGSLFAHYTGYVDPSSFDMHVSILILLMVMVGGAGTLLGPVLGALILSLLPEIFKFVPLAPGVAAASRQLLYGLMLILIVYFRPQGLFSYGRRRHRSPKTGSASPGQVRHAS